MFENINVTPGVAADLRLVIVSEREAILGRKTLSKSKDKKRGEIERNRG